LLLIYRTAFVDYHLSYAAAMALLLVLLILVLTLVQNWLSKRWVFYQ
jgi:multiple sugar transport system permease protein